LLFFGFRLLSRASLDNHESVIQVNDKGQLRLSRRALLPDADPEDPSAKQHTGSTTKDAGASQKTPEEGSGKKVVNAPKDGLAEKNNEEPKDKSSTTKLASSTKSTAAEDAQLPQKKFIRRLAGAAKDRSTTIKDTSKKSSSVSSKDETSLVNGEAKIGS
jgi:polyribonucleotide nucleotidyltransferase